MMVHEHTVTKFGLDATSFSLLQLIFTGFLNFQSTKAIQAKKVSVSHLAVICLGSIFVMVL